MDPYGTPVDTERALEETAPVYKYWLRPVR